MPQLFNLKILWFIRLEKWVINDRDLFLTILEADSESGKGPLSGS
jgi:hypothetical protein